MKKQKKEFKHAYFHGNETANRQQSMDSEKRKRNEKLIEINYNYCYETYSSYFYSDGNKNA